MQTQNPVNNLNVKNNVDTKIYDINVQGNKSKKSYPQDYRNQVVAVYKSGLYSTIEECAVAYGISSKTLYRWLDLQDKKSTPAAITAQQSEIADLKKELAKAKMENDILKKAAIYFANQAR